MVLHTHGHTTTTRPEQMHFTAYITGQQHLKYEVPISRIAQIFTADIIPSHCQNYAAQCAVSRVPADVMTCIPRPASGSIHNTPLSRHPSPTSLSQFVFHGYPAGILESYLLEIQCSSSRARSSFAPAVKTLPPPSPSLNNAVTTAAKYAAVQDASAMRILSPQISAVDTSGCLAKKKGASVAAHRSRHRDTAKSNPFEGQITLVMSQLKFRDSIGDASGECDEV